MANIGKYVEEANRFFNAVAKELDTPTDTDHASRVTTAVLHSLRERISVEESLHLISSLPLIIKGIYVDGWKISKTSYQADSLHDFLQLVRENALVVPGRDFGNDKTAAENIRAVIRVMRHYVAPGEFRDLTSQLPEELAGLFQ